MLSQGTDPIKLCCSTGRTCSLCCPAATLPTAESTRILLSLMESLGTANDGCDNRYKKYQRSGIKHQRFKPSLSRRQAAFLHYLSTFIRRRGKNPIQQALPGISGNSKAQPQIFEGFTFKEREDSPPSCQHFVCQPACWV